MILAPSKMRGVVRMPTQSPNKLLREELEKRERVEALEKLFDSFEPSPQRRFVPVLPTSQTTLSASPEKKGRTTRKPRQSREEQSKSFRCATPNPDAKVRKLVLNAKPTPTVHTKNNSTVNEAYDCSCYQNSMAVNKSLATTFYIKRAPFHRAGGTTFELKGTRLNLPAKTNPLFSVTRISSNNNQLEYYEQPSVARYYYRAANAGAGRRSCSKEPERPSTAAVATDPRRVRYARGRKRLSRSRVDCETSFVHPLTPQEYRGTRRLLFNRRVGFSNKKLLVFNFEGVVGDFYVPNVWQQTDTISLYIRPGAVSTLNTLAQSNQLVLLFNCLPDQAEFVLNYLLKAGARVDAAYLVAQGVWSQKPFSYEQIYIDFEIVSRVVCKAIVISHPWSHREQIIGSYCCERLDKEQLLCSKDSIVEVSRTIPLVLPRSYCKSVPIVVLLRDAKLGPGLKVAPLSVLESILSKLQEDCDPELSSWEQFKTEAGKSKECLAVETDRILGQIAEKARSLCSHSEEDTVKFNATTAKSTAPAEPLTDLKYTELMIRNEEIRNGINEYYQKRLSMAEQGKTCKTLPDFDFSRPLVHRIVIIREPKSGLGKYAPVSW